MHRGWCRGMAQAEGGYARLGRTSPSFPAPLFPPIDTLRDAYERNDRGGGAEPTWGQRVMGITMVAFPGPVTPHMPDIQGDRAGLEGGRGV